MFCRAGSPKSWTLKPQAVLWMPNNASLSQELVPRRTSVHTSIMEICGVLVRFPWYLIVVYTAASEILPHKYFNPHDHGAILQFFHFDLFLSPSFHSPATIRCVHMYVWSLQDPRSVLPPYWEKITGRMWNYSKGFSMLYTSYYYRNPLFPLKPRFPGDNIASSKIHLPYMILADIDVRHPANCLFFLPNTINGGKMNVPENPSLQFRESGFWRSHSEILRELKSSQIYEVCLSSGYLLCDPRFGSGVRG